MSDEPGAKRQKIPARSTTPPPGVAICMGRFTPDTAWEVAVKRLIKEHEKCDCVDVVAIHAELAPLHDQGERDSPFRQKSLLEHILMNGYRSSRCVVRAVCNIPAAMARYNTVCNDEGTPSCLLEDLRGRANMDLVVQATTEQQLTDIMTRVSDRAMSHFLYYIDAKNFAMLVDKMFSPFSTRGDMDVRFARLEREFHMLFGLKLTNDRIERYTQMQDHVKSKYMRELDYRLMCPIELKDALPNTFPVVLVSVVCSFLHTMI